MTRRAPRWGAALTLAALLAAGCGGDAGEVTEALPALPAGRALDPAPTAPSLDLRMDAGALTARLHGEVLPLRQDPPERLLTALSDGAGGAWVVTEDPVGGVPGPAWTHPALRVAWHGAVRPAQARLTHRMLPAEGTRLAYAGAVADGDGLALLASVVAKDGTRPGWRLDLVDARRGRVVLGAEGLPDAGADQPLELLALSPTRVYLVSRRGLWAVDRLQGTAVGVVAGLPVRPLRIASSQGEVVMVDGGGRAVVLP